MTATLSQSQADLPRLVELASQGEDVLITVGGKPKARITRATESNPTPSTLDLSRWMDELAELRQRNDTGKQGLGVEQILAEDRADR